MVRGMFPSPARAPVVPVEMDTARGRALLRVRVAATFRQRLVGLLGKPPLGPDEGLLLPFCSSVHTIGMRHAIDVIHLDAQGRVIKCVAGLQPMRASICLRAAHVLELREGALARLGIRPCDRLPLTALIDPRGRPLSTCSGRMDSGKAGRSAN